jgi:hypothetical protein
MPKGYPRKTDLLSWDSNFFLWWERVEAKQREPNTLKWA